MELKELTRQIQSGKIAPVYFIFGDETYPIDWILQMLTDKITEPSTRDFNRDVLQAESVDGETLISLASSYPMMSEMRLVIVKSVQRFSPSDKKRLIDYVKNPMESTCLVLVASRADRRQTFYADLCKYTQWA